jgi:hypothetical protein
MEPFRERRSRARAGPLVAAASARLDGDARSDLALLLAHAVEPLLALSARGAEHVVNSNLDTPDGAAARRDLTSAPLRGVVSPLRRCAA